MILSGVKDDDHVEIELEELEGLVSVDKNQRNSTVTRVSTARESGSNYRRRIQTILILLAIAGAFIFSRDSDVRIVEEKVSEGEVEGKDINLSLRGKNITTSPAALVFDENVDKATNSPEPVPKDESSTIVEEDTIENNKEEATIEDTKIADLGNESISSTEEYENKDTDTTPVKQELAPTENQSSLEGTENITSEPKTALDSNIIVNATAGFDLREEQIENYKAGSALMLNVHVTHHAGTTMCFEMLKWGPTPSFACMGETNKTVESLNALKEANAAFPWEYNHTAKYVDSLRQYYHMISEEFGHHPKQSLGILNWEYPNLLSIYVSRDPIDRLLSGDGNLNQLYGDEKDRNKEQWQGFAQSWQANNYALDVLTEKKCVNGENTTLECLDSAKDLLKRFTFVLDEACLFQGIQKMAELLGKPVPEFIRGNGKVKSTKATAKERIPYTDLYDYLVEKNKMSIALYEWSKGISLVKCE